MKTSNSIKTQKHKKTLDKSIVFGKINYIEENLEKLIEQESNEDIKRELKLAMYLYKDLLNDKNKKTLDEYTDTLLNI